MLVNRVWQQHFGKGLVGTPSNFGKLGDRPTHPELLDHLATRFLASGWSIKALHREILLSATYQLGCDREEGNAAADPGNQWLGHMNRRRLDVEAWRDALLAASGELDAHVGGSPTELGDAGNKRRTLYGKISRHNLDNLLRLFDFPDPNITSALAAGDDCSLAATVRPQQRVHDRPGASLGGAAGGRGQGRCRPHPQGVRARVRPARRRARRATGAGVPPRPEESVRPGEAKATLSRWEQYAQVLLGANEFTFID